MNRAARRFAALDDVVRAALGSRFSAAVVRVERGGRLAFERAYGTTRAGGGVAIAVDTRFDLASLTKIVASTALLRLVAAGTVALDAPAAETLHEWRATAHAPITWRHLLAHVSGMHSGADYRLLLADEVVAYALRLPLADAPGARVVYSDLGFIVLGAGLERRLGVSLAVAIADACAPLRLEATAYRPRGRARRAIPATERDTWRGLVQGSVHDEKAHLMGGVAAHAGLFGSARDVARVAEAYLGPLHGRPGPLPEALVREAIAEQAWDPILRRGLGWALRTTDENSCGTRIAQNAFGHTGFTGTCVWADPERDLTIVLLTNSVHFGRRDLRDVRAAVCDAAVGAVAR